MDRVRHSAGSPQAVGRLDGRGVTIDDVAEAAGVSRQTVSNVVNETGRVGEGTRQRVRAVIDQVGYRPHQGARGMRSRRMHQVAHPMPSSELLRGNLVSIEFVQELVSAAGGRGYYVLLAAAEGVDGMVELVRSRSIDGFVLANTDTGDDRARVLTEWGVPFVCFGRTEPGLPQTWVDFHNGRAIRRVVDHLAAAGHRRIAYIGSASGCWWDLEREQGFRDGMSQAGLATRPSYLRRTAAAEGEGVADRLLRLKHPPTAVITGDDALAAAVYRAARARGLHVGRDADLAVTGFGRTTLGRALDPSLTSVEIPLATIADLVLDRLLQEIEAPTGAPGQWIEAPLIVGDSA